MTIGEQIETAVAQIDELQALTCEERKIRLAELKERFRLLGLYEQSGQYGENRGNCGGLGELEEVRKHLEPLGLAGTGTPVVELARLAAIRITEK